MHRRMEPCEFAAGKSTGHCSQPCLKIVNFVNELLVLGIHCSSRGNLQGSSIFKIDKVALEVTEKRELIYNRDEEEKFGKSPFWGLLFSVAGAMGRRVKKLQ